MDGPNLLYFQSIFMTWTNEIKQLLSKLSESSKPHKFQDTMENIKDQSIKTNLDTPNLQSFYSCKRNKLIKISRKTIQ